MYRPNKTVLALLGVFVLVTVLWNTPVMLPLKILVVFFHEISHGFAAVLTGGEIDRLSVEMNQSGMAWTRGGIRFVIVSAGYLGSFLWGSALILGSAYTKRDRLITGALGLILVYVTIFYVRNLTGVLFGLATAAALLAAARWLSDPANDFLLKVVGVSSCGYAILDVYSDVVAGSCWSDARMLAVMTFIPAVVWGVLWIGLSLVGLYYTLLWAARAEERRGWRR
ncbi:MAG: M50 family metallopeptidase [Elusimicrobiota bacterium]